MPAGTNEKSIGYFLYMPTLEVDCAITTSLQLFLGATYARQRL